MANKIPMHFKRGDGVTHYFRLPIDNYVPGSFLWFAAKPEPDNDNTDMKAVIDKKFDDTDVDIVTNPNFAEYTLNFDASDIIGVNYSNGESVKRYKGEFQYLIPGEQPTSFPGDNNYLEVSIFADIKRGVS